MRAPSVQSVTRARHARATLRWIAFIALPVTVWPAVAWLHTERLPASALALHEAQAVGDGGTQPLTLPDDWRTTGRTISERTYELEFPAAGSEGGDWAVYLPSVSMTASVFLNGHFLGDGGDAVVPVPRNWFRPLLFSFSRSQLTRGTNRLRIVVRSDFPGTGILGTVAVGPHRDLARAHARRYRLKVTSLWVITLCLVMVGAFMAALWAGWREETSYGWFAGGALAWVGIHLNGLIVNVPVETVTWTALGYCATGWWATLQVRFLLAYLGETSPRFERAVGALTLSGTAIVLALALLRSPWIHPFARLWVTLGLLAGGFAVARVLRRLYDRGAEIGSVIPYVASLSVVVCALHDWLLFVGVTKGDYDYYLPYSAPLLILGMGWALLARFVGALRMSESLVVDLEDRVERKRDELARSYELLRDVERSRVLAEERERIMREMHDGLGSHLVSTLSLIERESSPREAVRQAVRSALDDLRLMVDSLEPLEGDLVGALATLRARLQPRLEAAGIVVEWRVKDLPSVPDFGPQKILQVLRILQEAVTNVLKHAGARTITVSTRDEEPSPGSRRVCVEVLDDGEGLVAAGRIGRGLAHMRGRAAEIGAHLEIDGSSRGTRVKLSIPLREPAPA
jgi:signal transduction histidine kinase